jgi:phosphate-selective porin OprO/OprP
VVLGVAMMCLAALASVAHPGRAIAQSTAVASESTIDTTLQAGEADAVEPRRKLVKWNEYDGPISTLRLGFGLGLEAAAYHQDKTSKQQVTIDNPDGGLRDFRLLLKGRFKTKRPISWTLGYMYDGADKQWRFRQTGIQVAVPELSGQFFVGRTKEGYSQTKVMTGYYIWGVERSQSLDAFVPILGDGIKYMGYYPRARIALNLGAYDDKLAEDEKFATSDNQFVTRLVWQPILSDADHEVLHLGIMGRQSKPDGGFSREKSRPGAYLAPFFLDTGKFPADHSRTFGFEAIYRSGPWLFATEYDWQRDEATSGENPVFHGGDASVVWLITGETRPYNATGAFFDRVSPAKSAFHGGGGAVEGIVTMTYNDFDDESFHGGKFWRLTPMVIWHMDELVHLSFVYGYGKLDRFNVKGTTEFFQTRFLVYL